MRRVVVTIAGSILISACCHGTALAAPCPAGEVWGDFGCRPKAQQSIRARRQAHQEPLAQAADPRRRSEIALAPTSSFPRGMLPTSALRTCLFSCRKNPPL
jgi:hypothetical protein